MELNVERVVKTYIKIRDEKERITKEYQDAVAKLQTQLDALEKKMLAFSVESGVASFKTPFGTCYKKTSEKASVADWSAFSNWMLAQHDVSFVEQRVKISSVRDYADQNSGSLPPGVHVFREDKMYFNRPTK